MALNSKTVSVDNLVLQGIVQTVKSSGTLWAGTMTDLDSNLVQVFSRSRNKMNSLPGSPSALRVVINRITNRLRTRGLSVRFWRDSDHTRTRLVQFVSSK